MASGLRENRHFVRWALADGISVTGTAISSVVLPIIVFSLTKSPGLTGALFAVRVVPYILFGSIAGPVADRWNRRRLIVGGPIIEGLLGATIPIAALLGILTVAQVFIVGLLSATAFVFADAAVFGAVPTLVGTENLAAANGFLGATVSAAEIVGPGIGGLLASTIGTSNAVWFDVASFFIAAAMQGSIRSKFRTGVPPSGGLQVRAQLKHAIGFVRGNRPVATLLLTGFGNSLGFGVIVGLMVPYAVQRLGLPEKNVRVGLLFSAYGGGALLSGLVFARLFTPKRVQRMTPVSVGLASVLAVGLVLSTDWRASAVVLLLYSLAVTTTITTGITYRQLAAPDDLRSSVNVFGRMVSWGGQPVGAGAGAVIASLVDVRAAYIFTVVITAISSACAYWFLRRGTEIAGIDP